MINRFIFWFLLLLLLMSAGLNAYQIHVFSTQDRFIASDINDESNESDTGSRQNFVLELDIDQEGYKTARSTPFWIKQKLGNMLIYYIKNKYEQINIDEELFMVFGVISEYKGIDELIEVFTSLKRIERGCQ